MISVEGTSGGIGSAALENITTQLDTINSTVNNIKSNLSTANSNINSINSASNTSAIIPIELEMYKKIPFSVRINIPSSKRLGFEKTYTRQNIRNLYTNLSGSINVTNFEMTDHIIIAEAPSLRDDNTIYYLTICAIRINNYSYYGGYIYNLLKFDRLSNSMTLVKNNFFSIFGISVSPETYQPDNFHKSTKTQALNNFLGAVRYFSVYSDTEYVYQIQMGTEKKIKYVKGNTEREITLPTGAISSTATSNSQNAQSRLLCTGNPNHPLIFICFRTAGTIGTVTNVNNIEAPNYYGELVYYLIDSSFNWSTANRAFYAKSNTCYMWLSKNYVTYDGCYYMVLGCDDSGSGYLNRVRMLQVGPTYMSVYPEGEGTGMGFNFLPSSNANPTIDNSFIVASNGRNVLTVLNYVPTYSYYSGRTVYTNFVSKIEYDLQNQEFKANNSTIVSNISGYRTSDNVTSESFVLAYGLFTSMPYLIFNSNGFLFTCTNLDVVAFNYWLPSIEQLSSSEASVTFRYLFLNELFTQAILNYYIKSGKIVHTDAESVFPELTSSSTASQSGFHSFYEVNSVVIGG